MAEKTREISAQELLSIIESGGKLRIQDRPSVIAQFDELVEKVDGLVKVIAETARADLARSQTQLEILATLQAQIRSQNVTKSHPVDMTPLKTVLTEISDNTLPRQLSGYEFEVTSRDRMGDIEKLRVLPVPPTKH